MTQKILLRQAYGYLAKSLNVTASKIMDILLLFHKREEMCLIARYNVMCNSLITLFFAKATCSWRDVIKHDTRCVIRETTSEMPLNGVKCESWTEKTQCTCRKNPWISHSLTCFHTAHLGHSVLTFCHHWTMDWVPYPRNGWVKKSVLSIYWQCGRRINTVDLKVWYRFKQVS